MKRFRMEWHPMMQKVTAILCSAALMGGCATQVLTSGRVQVRDEHAVVEVGFSDRDRSLIEDYYREAQPAKKTPPGSARREELPPGLARHGKLPPGLQGRLLPRELESRLTVLPSAYARLLIGRDVVLIERDTRRVLDILYGVIPEPQAP
jgi:hypothetical protein